MKGLKITDAFTNDNHFEQMRFAVAEIGVEIRDSVEVLRADRKEGRWLYGRCINNLTLVD